MKLHAFTIILTVLAALALGSPNAWARKGKKAATPQVELSPSGKQLENSYSKELESLKKDITRAIPNISGQAKSNYNRALKEEEQANAKLKAAEKNMAKINSAYGLIGHSKKHWIPKAEKSLKQAEANLKNANSDSERETAKTAVEKAKKDLQAGHDALKQRLEALEQAKRDEPKIKRELEAAKEELKKAAANAMAAVNNLRLDSILSSDKLDAQLAKFVVMSEATPARLAAFAQQGQEFETLLDTFLGAEDLLIEMSVADGAKNGEYGRAAQIYSDIRKASPKSSEGVLHRLAIAVSLEHAVPIKQRNAVSDSNAPSHVNPVERYLHYEKAYHDGQLDRHFDELTAWDLRMVVDGEEPNEIITWGRQMLSNYRPDHITTNDLRWRYAAIVRSDVKYGSQDVKCDIDDHHFFQNILMNGGICGRRAFFGRFILRSFGVPTTARPQRGHAALVRWTPEGWVACLGAGWGSGWTKTPYESDLNFLATTQARATGDHYKKVKRAQWIGDAIGEKRVYGLISKNAPDFWNSVSLNTQRALIAASKSKTLAAVGEDIGEANETKEEVDIAKVTITKKDREVTIDSKGVITIPAAATTAPTSSNGKILFLNSNLGGIQLHYGRNGSNQTFEYTIKAPTAGKYALSARVVTPSWKQNLQLSLNDSDQLIQIDLPYTIGTWDQSAPVEIELKKGKNVLRFSRTGDIKGISIRDFTLTPTATGLSSR